MSGTILKQTNVSHEISIDGGTTFQDLPCVKTLDPGSASVPFEDTTCFSTPTAEPEYSSGRLTRSTGSFVVNANASDVHQYLLANPGAKVPIKSNVTFDNGAVYARQQDFLIGGTSEPIEIDSVFQFTTELQPTGEIIRTFTQA